jgi:sensor c-di-GMP phosphodiesterase-like protein
MEAATSQVIVHVIEMAKSLGLDIVAEGVQTHLQAGWLIKHGVASAQGFLFSEPLPKEEFLAFLRHHQARAAAA